MSIEFSTACELAEKIRNKEVSSRELTDLYIERIERLDGEVNAVVVRDFDRARAAADRADQALSEGRSLGPLHGVPMTIKEAYNMADLPTTWGLPDFKDNIATEDSESVARFKAAGAIFLGKTNVPLNLADFQSYNEVYGTTGNPWSTDRTPGGSSGGSSAALAAGFSALEAGSDIGGSIRNPAHFCGVYGHKPTWNIVPQQGHALPGMLASPDIAVVGPLARSAEDLALALDVVSGPEPLVESGWKLELPPPRHAKLSDYRVALWPTDPMAPVAGEVAGRVQQMGDRLAALGATVSDSARPAFEVARSHETYLYMLNGVMAADLPQEVLDAMEAQVSALDPADQSDNAVMARAAVQKHGDWLRYNNRRESLRMAWRDFFQDWDILLCPQTATPAFKHDHRPIPERTLAVDDVMQPYFQQLFWAGLTTVAYLPSTVFPTGLSGDGLPIGLQAVSAEYADRTCIDFARLMADEIGGFVPPPGY
jgi:amidase